MKFQILLTMAIFAAPAMANSFRTVRKSHVTPRYDYSVEYPLLLNGSTPGYQAINTHLKLNVIENGCDVDQGSKQIQYNYNVTVKVVALNSGYVGFRVEYDNYCGGAHPNYGTYFMTYEASTGKYLEIEREFGFKDPESADYDGQADEVRRHLLAEMMVAKVPRDLLDNDCFTYNGQPVADGIALNYPYVAGLANRKRVIMAISPPHVASICYFDAVFSYDEVKNLIDPGSYLHGWLR